MASKKYKDQTLAILTGFITGSLAIIWPWKEVEESIIIGDKEKIIDYQLLIPQELNQENIIAIILMMMGIAIVYAIENFRLQKNEKLRINWEKV